MENCLYTFPMSHSFFFLYHEDAQVSSLFWKVPPKNIKKIEPVLKRTVNSWLKNKVEQCEGKSSKNLDKYSYTQVQKGILSKAWCHICNYCSKFTDTRATMRPYLKMEHSLAVGKDFGFNLIVLATHEDNFGQISQPF